MLNKRLLSFAILTTSSLCSNIVFAQDVAPTDAAGQPPAAAASSSLEEIIVTAEKRSERLRDVPMSVTAVTGSQLQDQGVTSPADLAKLVPGFTFTESTYGAPVYTLRGIGTYDEAIAISPVVGVYSDQIPLPFARMSEGVSLDLQRVEVLKGPQGTLFGENSTGGAVNYIPNRPTDHFAAGSSLTYGRFDETDAEGYVSGPVFGTVNARLAVRTEQRGDWQYNRTNDDTLGQRLFLSSLLSRSPTVIPPGGYITLDPTTNKPLTNGLFSNLNQDNVSWRVGPSWKPADDVLLYFNVAKGYKAGAFGTLPVIRPAQDAPVVQESVLAYEIGFKTAALAHRVELSGAAFHYDYDNKQLLASKNVGSPFGTLPALANIPRSRIEGAELDATVRPWRSFTLRAGGTYVDSKVLGSYVISSPIGGGATDTINIGGEPFPATPKWQLDADAEYDRPISSDWTGFLGVGSTYQSTSQGTFGDIPSLQLPSYGLVDLRIGANSQNWHVELWGRNITDRYYLIHAFRATDTITRTTGFPATFGITIRATF